MDENTKMLKAALTNAQQAQSNLQKGYHHSAAANIKYIVDALTMIVDAESDNDDLFDAESTTTEVNTISMNEIY